MDLTTAITTLIDQLVENKTEEVDSIALFINDCLVPCEEMRETLGNVHRAYLTYCAERGYVAKAICHFSPELRSKGLTVKTGRGNRFFVHKHYLIYK